ncbi:hypothetical protein ACN47E_006652 [Coniothyrium glycines]
MSKVKAPKTKGVPNRHLHARTSFLYQAATYLTLQTASSTIAIGASGAEEARRGQNAPHRPPVCPLSLHLGSDLQQVSRKGQLRLSIALKRSLCKSCNTVLIPGKTSTQTIENQSKDCKKPWADVLLVTCNFCGSTKRFPVGAARQLARAKRKAVPPDMTAAGAASEGTPLSESTLLTVAEQTSTDGWA